MSNNQSIQELEAVLNDGLTSYFDRASTIRLITLHEQFPQAFNMSLICQTCQEIRELKNVHYDGIVCYMYAAALHKSTNVFTVPQLEDICTYTLDYLSYNQHNIEAKDVKSGAIDFWSSMVSAHAPFIKNLIKSNLKKLIEVLLNTMNNDRLDEFISVNEVGNRILSTNCSFCINVLTENDPLLEEDVIQLLVAELNKRLSSNDWRQVDLAVYTIQQCYSGTMDRICDALPQLFQIICDCMASPYPQLVCTASSTLRNLEPFISSITPQFILSSQTELFMKHTLETVRDTAIETISELFENDVEPTPIDELLPLVPQLLEACIRILTQPDVRFKYLNLLTMIGGCYSYFGSNMSQFSDKLIQILIQKGSNLETIDNEEIDFWFSAMDRITSAVPELMLPFSDKIFEVCIRHLKNATTVRKSVLNCLDRLVENNVVTQPMINNSDLLDLLIIWMQIADIQPEICFLIGTLSRKRFYGKVLTDIFIPKLSELLIPMNKSTTYVVWTIGELIQYCTDIRMYNVSQLINSIINITVNTNDFKEKDNAVYAYCCMGLVYPDAVDSSFENMIETICSTIQELDQIPERLTIFQGLFRMMTEYLNVTLLHFPSILTAIATVTNQLPIEHQSDVKKVLHGIKCNFAPHVWNSTLGRLDNEHQIILRNIYSVTFIDDEDHVTNSLRSW
jgi:hypothetical protein